jgi:hypothetical protein
MAKLFNQKAYKAKKRKLGRKLHKMSRELHKMCRHLKHM